MQFAILFSPTARVYNLRFLLVATAATLVYISVGPLRVTFQSNPAIQLWLVSCAVIIVHLVISVFAWRIRGLAAIDLAVLIIEIGAVGYPVYWFMGTLFVGVPIMQLLALLLSALFRFATVLESKDKFFHQRFYFLGGCTPIFIGRGESTPYIKHMSGTWEFMVIYPLINATVSLQQISLDGQIIMDNGIQVSMNEETGCPRISSQLGLELDFQCPNGWDAIYTISISIPVPPGVGGVYLVRLQGHQLTAVVHGSNLFGVLTWTEQHLIRSISWTTSFTYDTEWIPEISALQPYPPDPTSSNITRLTLMNRSQHPTRLTQETIDNTILSGRRPLSALGFVHIFQRRSLVRQWHEDFPTLHSEGGLPGSESAGIVAFIRERLVDVGDDPRLNHESPNGLEAQTVPGTLTSTGDEMREANRPMLHYFPNP
ncbi:hypothetical protein B0H13DRAFT_1885334 [Mycena leptocephala]|nr:hypothetical protein B0H13DRAFT_1885334 [Mycena leptocephala]